MKEDRKYITAAKALMQTQKVHWEQCKNGYATLASVKTKVFQFNNFSIKVQFNPGRMISTSAKVDEQSINDRKCFLCKENLPQEQQSVDYKDDFLILVNPFPIFPEHFTLPSIHHTKQDIENSFFVFLYFCRDLNPDFSVFYNGPKCGASAPDHLHFQAGTKYFMPIDLEYEQLKKKFGEELIKIKSLHVFAIDDGLRKMISFEGNSTPEIEEVFQIFYSSFKKITGQDEEPMMNIIGSYQNKKWRVIIFLRKKHRPDAFFEEDQEKRILLSPAAVDIGGVCITPREKDFETITQEKLKEIFTEVFFDESFFLRFKKKLQSDLELYYYS